MSAETDTETGSLAALLDERDIVAVVSRYCRALDTKDWPLLDDVFVADATAQLGQPDTLVGRDAVVERITNALDKMDTTQHLVGNHEVVLDGDLATHRCYLQAQHVRESVGGDPHYIVAGQYDDRFVRTSHGWRIAHRTLNVMWTAGNLAVSREPKQ